MANISVVIPTYNERDNVVLLVQQIVKLLPDSTILVVDDNSPDGTAEVLRNLKIPNLMVFVRNERGLGSALRYGICLLYTSPSPRDRQKSRMPSSA